MGLVSGNQGAIVSLDLDIAHWMASLIVFSLRRSFSPCPYQAQFALLRLRKGHGLRYVHSEPCLLSCLGLNTIQYKISAKNKSNLTHHSLRTVFFVHQSTCDCSPYMSSLSWSIISIRSIQECI
jgi:hypothetical protein